MKGWTGEEFRNRDLMAPLRAVLRDLRSLHRHSRRQREIQGGNGQSLRNQAGRNGMLRVHADGPPKKDLRLLQGLRDPQLREIQRILLLPSMRGVALPFHRKVLFRHRRESYEKGHPDLAGKSCRAGA